MRGFGEYGSDEEQDGLDERMEALRQLLGVDEPEVATKTQRLTDDRRDATGRRISKPHQPGAAPPQSTRRRDHEGYRLDKENDLRRFRR